MKVSGTIPNMFNGVSQQAASLRHPSQCEEQVNALSTIAGGLQKRPPTKHIAQLTAGSFLGNYIHTINRDATEQYKVVITNGDVQVFKLDGTEKAVTFPDGTDYLTSSDPASDFVAVTVADYTFIVNRSVTTAMLPDVTGKAVTPDTVSSITQAAGTATLTVATAHNLAVGDYINVAGANQSAYNGWHEVLTTPTGATLTFAVDSGTASPATGTITYTAVKGSVQGTKQEFTNLAAPTATGNIFEIAGSPSNAFDNYYVVDSAGPVHLETVAPGVKISIDPATMPHALIRQPSGDFTLEQIDWDDRLVGDDDSNPQPSFIGRTIRDLFFYRNRLGFISSEGYQMSRPGDYFNYWITSVTAALDTDPVDSEVSHTKVSVLNFAVPFNKSLIMFSDQTQFQVTGGDVFTQASNRADVVSEFSSSSVCRPIGLNTSLYFVTNRSGYSGVREYYVDEDTISNDAADITAHVPRYLPIGIQSVAACGSEDALFLHANTNQVFVYKFYWGDKEKLQSSWSTFEFDEGDTILDVAFIDTVAYFVIERADGVYLESMDLQPSDDTGFVYCLRLDRRIEDTGVYNSGTNLTTWTLPYEDDGDFRVVLGAAFGTSAGTSLSISRPTSSTITAVGDYSAGDAYIGRAYEMRYQFSEIYIRGEGKTAMRTGRLQLNKMTVSYEDSGYFEVRVTPKARETYTYRFTGKVLGDSEFKLGVDGLLSGVFAFPIQSRNLETTITLTNDSHLPSTFQAAEWEGEFITYSQRI